MLSTWNVISLSSSIGFFCCCCCWRMYIYGINFLKKIFIFCQTVNNKFVPFFIKNGNFKSYRVCVCLKWALNIVPLFILLMDIIFLRQVQGLLKNERHTYSMAVYILDGLIYNTLLCETVHMVFVKWINIQRTQNEIQMKIEGKQQ